MKFLRLFFIVLLAFSCAKDGKDGRDGVDGKDGKAGINGINGIDGKDGQDGIKFSHKIFCMGTLVGGTYDGVAFSWDAMVTTLGDVLVAGSLYNIGPFNNTGTAFYSHTQIGASNGLVLIPISNTEYGNIFYDPETKNVHITINNESYENVNACRLILF